jgi:hypothetical protein
MIKWFKKLFRIIGSYDHDIENLYEWMRENRDEAQRAIGIAVDAEKVIRERTEIHADIHYHAEAPHQVIVIGKYRGGDYVQAFGVYDDGDLKHFIETLKEMERYGEIKRLDAPIQMKSFLEHELDRW